MKKPAPGIYIDDFSDDLHDLSVNLMEIGDTLSSLGKTSLRFVNEIDEYRSYLIKCILDKGETCGYTEAELMRFSVGILETIFVINRCHDVDYAEVLSYNDEHSSDPEGGPADEK